MAIQIVCDHCDRNLRLRDELAGKKIRCPDCQAILAVQRTERSSKPQSRPARQKKRRPKRRFPAADFEDSYIADIEESPAQSRRRTMTLDETTFASHPGNLIINPLMFWLSFPLWPTTFLIGTVAFLIPALNVHFVWSAGAILFGLLFLIYWIRAFEHFRHGCLCPAVVISAKSKTVAVFTDLSVGVGEYPAVRILRQPLAFAVGGPFKKGDRLATVALYQGDPYNDRHWATFHPRVVNCVTMMSYKVERALRAIPKSDWRALEKAVRELPNKKPGLIRLW